MVARTKFALWLYNESSGDCWPKSPADLGIWQQEAGQKKLGSIKYLLQGFGSGRWSRKSWWKSSTLEREKTINFRKSHTVLLFPHCPLGLSLSQVYREVTQSFGPNDLVERQRVAQLLYLLFILKVCDNHVHVDIFGMLLNAIPRSMSFLSSPYA